MKIKQLTQNFAVCKLTNLSQVDFEDEIFFVCKTDQELSLVCSNSHIPDNALECEEGWKAFRIEGVLDFSLIGILSQISALLAEKKIGIFAVSTYNTDYILTKEENFELAISTLIENGYECE